ncbi:hypothetical protein [Thiohalocapsa sp. ML1]|jgi:hypothetical protein|uniref:hypothetical protein n=1 Tax=Thiohalocapsa sp. ML1 TaxID=1431688 RepID=UPI0007323C96|nr:hypothetical protein [Thiohalocapsa sp. ML1]
MFSIIVRRQVLVATLLFCGFGAAYAGSIALDMTTTTGGFVISDPSLVQLGPAANEATLLEDSMFGVTYLSNDPFLGDPGVPVPLTATALTFDYEFSTSGDDNFSVSLLDPSGGPPLFEWLHDGTAMGPGTFNGDDILIDLVGLGLQGDMIGIEFLLNANLNDTTLDSVVYFSDVRFSVPDEQIPIGGTVWLFLLGLLPMRLYFIRDCRS